MCSRRETGEAARDAGRPFSGAPEPPGADPHAGWCGRGATHKVAPYADLSFQRVAEDRLRPFDLHVSARTRATASAFPDGSCSPSAGRPGRWRPLLRPRDDSRKRREIQQSVLLNHQDRKSKDHALERLHGFSRRLERIDCASSLNDRPSGNSKVRAAKPTAFALARIVDFAALYPHYSSSGPFTRMRLPPSAALPRAPQLRRAGPWTTRRARSPARARRSARSRASPH
jgi:hypothetical protein